MRQATIRALEIRDEADIIRGLTRGELEARILDAERAQASAPPDVSRQLRLTAQAEADAWQQAADAATRHDHAQAASAKALASQIAAERQQLEAANARYEKWSAATTGTRETAAKAKPSWNAADSPGNRPNRRSPRRGTEPGVGGAIELSTEREHQAAITTDEPWLPEHITQPELTPQNTPRPTGARRPTRPG